MDNTLINKAEPLSKELFAQYFQLSKFRLSVSVVGTTIITYFLGLYKTGLSFDWLLFFGLVIGGLLVVISANALNQVIEIDTDKLMSRTMDRPVANSKISKNDAIWFASVSVIIGLLMLTILVNGRCALLSLLSFFIYVLAYTPLKKISPFAVFVGAVPGALPASIGWIAVVGNIDDMAILFFSIQFFWQFPHFWSIAWLLENDYRKAGYTLLPSYEGRTKKNALQIIWYTGILFIITIYPVLSSKFSTIYSLIIIVPCAMYLLYRAYQLYSDLSEVSAKRLMFASLLYMPLILISYFF